MILRLLCIWLVFYSLLSSLMHGTMKLKFRLCIIPENSRTDVDTLHTAYPSVMLRLLCLLNVRLCVQNWKAPDDGRKSARNM